MDRNVKTPICDFVNEYAAKDPLRLHMPGHKGSTLLGPERLDITEIRGADALYGASGIIRESEEIAAGIFGTAKTLYSCEGSSLAIRAMLFLAALKAIEEGKRPKILAGRNAHKVFISQAAVLNIDVEWLMPENGEGGILSCVLSANRLETLLSGRVTAELPAAVYITSPDYLGVRSDIAALAEVCHSHGVLLLVDNAHGSYLHFLDEPRHPMDLGADVCSDSAHKTLTALTGGAYLHLSKRCPESLAEAAERAMALFASTSPSYLIMQSLDMANPYLAGEYPERLRTATRRLFALKKELSENGISLAGDEPLKLTVAAKSIGYRGTELSELLQREGIIDEFADEDFLVFMFSAENSEADYEKVRRALLEIPRKKAISTRPPRLDLSHIEQAMSPHDALFSASETVPRREAAGRILAIPTVGCPPAVPIVVCGERINKNAVEFFEYYGVESCVVTK